MYDFSKVKANLEARGFSVSCFATAEEACGYLLQKLAGKTVGHGGSVTLQEMGLLDKLSACAAVVSHWNGHTHAEAAAAPAATVAEACAAPVATNSAKIKMASC